MRCHGNLRGPFIFEHAPVKLEDCGACHLNLFLERLLSNRGYRVELRAGFNNISGHFNPTVVDNVLSGSTYLREYGGQPRVLNVQVRFLGHR